MDAIAQDHPARVLWRDVASRIAAAIRERAAHPARTVVLVPYAQLMHAARRAWGEHVPDGFAPRFETTANWASQVVFEPGAHDIAFDTGLDLLTARDLLVRSGLESRADALASRVVDAALQLAPLAQSVPAADRGAWAAQARAAVAMGMQADHLRLEEAVARVAVEWAAASSYATDALLDSRTLTDIDLVVVLEGLRQDPVQQALRGLAGHKAVTLSLLSPDAARGQLSLHACGDASDEAERAAACVLSHVQAGRTPVALAAIDRAATRRVASLLAQAGVQVRDEQGWKLSTARSAAQVMALLDACAWDASSDQVIDWLKHAPRAGTGAVLGLERRIRREGLRDWKSVREGDMGESQALRGLLGEVHAWRDAMQAPRPLAEWLQSLAQLLRNTGQWDALEADEAGALLLDALRLREGSAADLQHAPQARRRMSPGDLRSWVDDVLEAASFRPPAPTDAAVVILPFGQTLAREFAAIVLAGCDEQRLPASPEPAGGWTPAQCRALALPTREDLQAQQSLAWRQALAMPHVHVLWRAGDDNGEAILPSPLVQALVHEGVPASADPRPVRPLQAVPVPRPAASAPALRVHPLSASAYEDLRRCPYRFFALRQLALKEADEMDTEVDKRDFGNWLHSVLRGFHEALRGGGDAQGRAALLDRIAADALARLRLEEGEFLPFEAGWPGVRDAYLQWLETHEAEGASFLEAEAEHRRQLGDIELFGRVDRIDLLPGGRRLLIDYKTEGSKATEDRMREPLEDTQLAFYAVLLGDDDAEAAYLNIGERGKVTQVRHPDLANARVLIEAAMVDELGRIAAAQPLPALGEGRACEFCAARGLCRKDFWS